MKFSYQARTKIGELQVGTVEAANREAAFNILFSHGLYILKLESLKEFGLTERTLRFFRRVKKKDLMLFNRQLATMLSAKIPLVNCFKSLLNQTRNIILKETLSEMSADVEAGLSLSQALARHPHIFSDFFVNMIRSAEITGQIEAAMNYLADYYEKDVKLMSRVRNALIYPVTVIILFFVVAGLMLTLVLPQIAPIFQESGVSLPLLTRILIVSGLFMSQWWWLVILILAVMIFFLYDYLKTAEGKVVFDEISINLPILGIFFQKVIISRFCEAASVLIKGGIPITQAIEIASQTVGNKVYQEVLSEAADNIRAGELMSKAIADSRYFPPLVSQLVAVGEATGQLEIILSKISDYYTDEVDDIVANLVELIQPLLISVIGIFVGLLFASILLPIYQMAQLVR